VVDQQGDRIYFLEAELVTLKKDMALLRKELVSSGVVMTEHSGVEM
jgi:hypothetical protein